MMANLPSTSTRGIARIWRSPCSASSSGRLLLLDMAATRSSCALTHNIALSVLLGMALGMAQIGWQLVRRKPSTTMQWSV